jgi:hypothetical protein
VDGGVEQDDGNPFPGFRLELGLCEECPSKITITLGDSKVIESLLIHRQAV